MLSSPVCQPGYEAVYFLWLVSLLAFTHTSSTVGNETTPEFLSTTSLNNASATTSTETFVSRVAASGRLLSLSPTAPSSSSWGSDAGAQNQYPNIKRATTYPRRALQYKRYAGGSYSSGPMTPFYETDDNDSSDVHQTPTYYHPWHAPSPPVVYVSDNHHPKESSWDLTTKLIVLAVLKIFLTKIIGIGVFKFIMIMLFKLPFIVFFFAAKFAIFLKFIKFLKLITALLLLPLFLLLLLPLLLPLLLLLLPLLLLPLLLLFPVPVLAPNGAASASAGRRRREEDVNRIHNAVLDAQLCFQRLACHVGEASRPTVGPYASWSLWLLDLVSPLFPSTKRGLLTAYSDAYRKGIEGTDDCSAEFHCKFVESTNSTTTSNRRKGRRRRSYKSSI